MTGRISARVLCTADTAEVDSIEKGEKKMARRKPSKEKKIQMNLDERFRQLRTNIEFSQFDQNLKVINVVSTFPNEGKSTVAQNLAKVYAAQFRKVLLVDCDLRNPSVHKMTNLTKATGLSNLLTHLSAEENLLVSEEIQKTSLDGQNECFVLTAGTRVPNPQELLSSNRFSQFIQMAKEQFDFVIIDCPPCMAVSDAIPVCNAADGTLYVVSARDTDKAAAKEGLNELRRNGAAIIGAVLTKAEDQRQKHGYYYYNYGYGYGGYGYGYGYGYGSGSQDEEEKDKENEGKKSRWKK